MVVPFLQLVATLSLFTAVAVGLRSRRFVRRTTLTQAWGWGMAALLLWSVAWSIDVFAPFFNAPRDGAGADHLWYVAAIMMLCSLVAVLGAKRPGAGVWTWFVLLPLMLVLGWPAAASWFTDSAGGGFELETPALAGYALVLVMGTGNYLGTRFWPAAGLLAVALVLVVAPFSAAVPLVISDPVTARLAATFCVSAAVFVAARSARRRCSLDAEPIERLWIDFRDYFGIVWARRILDRVNHTAEKERWPVHLEIHGLVWGEAEVSPEEQAKAFERLEQTFRWLLRRFVDPDWIDERLRVS